MLIMLISDPCKKLNGISLTIICLTLQELPGDGGLLLPGPSRKQRLVHVQSLHSSPDDIPSGKSTAVLVNSFQRPPFSFYRHFVLYVFIPNYALGGIWSARTQ